MPKVLYEIKNQKKNEIKCFVLSNDWFSLQPWEYKKTPIRFFDYTFDSRETCYIETYYIGPFAFLKGKSYE